MLRKADEFHEKRKIKKKKVIILYLLLEFLFRIKRTMNNDNEERLMTRRPFRNKHILLKIICTKKNLMKLCV